MNIIARLEKIFPLITNLFIPAAIFGIALMSFYICGNFAPASNMTMHTVFYVLAFISFMTLLYFNQSKPVFFILCGVLSYILINYFKNKYAAGYLLSPAFQNLWLFVPLNLALFYFWPNQRLLTRTNVYLLVAIFAQYTMAEHLTKQGIDINFSLTESPITGTSGFWIFVIVLCAAFIRAALTGFIMDYSLFFAALCFFFGFVYSDTASGLTVFFCAGMLCLIISIVQTLYNETYKDPLTGLASRNSYIIHTKNFPLKYSIGIVSLDDFDKLGINLGRRNQNIITKLIACKIMELEQEENIYRYSPDEFVIIFKNLDKNESFERLETIRRAIAAASFLFNPRRKALKLTVSASVSEKKRSDANSFEVLVRARKVLQKTRSFSHNVTSKA